MKLPKSTEGYSLAAQYNLMLMNEQSQYTCHVCGDIETEYVYSNQGIKVCSQGCLDALESTVIIDIGDITDD